MKVGSYQYFNENAGSNCDLFCQMIFDAGNRADAGLKAGVVGLGASAIIGATGGLTAGGRGPGLDPERNCG